MDKILKYYYISYLRLLSVNHNPFRTKNGNNSVFYFPYFVLILIIQILLSLSLSGMYVELLTESTKKESVNLYLFFLYSYIFIYIQTIFLGEGGVKAPNEQLRNFFAVIKLGTSSLKRTNLRIITLNIFSYLFPYLLLQITMTLIFCYFQNISISYYMSYCIFIPIITYIIIMNIQLLYVCRILPVLIRKVTPIVLLVLSFAGDNNFSISMGTAVPCLVLGVLVSFVVSYYFIKSYKWKS